VSEKTRRKDMINNYLDWAKQQRRAALKEMYHARGMSRLDPTKWGTGFYAGHAQAHSFEARHWRRLQKDIEATLKVVADNWPRESTDPLVAKFDI